MAIYTWYQCPNGTKVALLPGQTLGQFGAQDCVEPITDPASLPTGSGAVYQKDSVTGQLTTLGTGQTAFMSNDLLIQMEQTGAGISTYVDPATGKIQVCPGSPGCPTSPLSQGLVTDYLKNLVLATPVGDLGETLNVPASPELAKVSPSLLLLRDTVLQAAGSNPTTPQVTQAISKTTGTTPTGSKTGGPNAPPQPPGSTGDLLSPRNLVLAGLAVAGAMGIGLLLLLHPKKRASPA